MEDLNDKITGGNLSAAEWNQVPSEIQNVIENLGQVLTNADLNQLGKSIAGYVANGTFYTDSGIADAYVLTKIGLKQTPTARADGHEIRFYASNPNAGASTVNDSALGVVDLVQEDGTALPAGFIDVITQTVASFDVGAGKYLVTSAAGVGVGLTAASQAQQEAAASNIVAATPANQQFHPSAAKAWVNFDGTGVPSINDSYNVSGIVDNGTGDYTINFTTPFVNTSYVAFGMTKGASTSIIRLGSVASLTTGSARINTMTVGGGFADSDEVTVAFLGDQ